MRIALAVVAVLVLGWLLVIERDVRLTASGTAAAVRGGDALPGAERDLRRARLLNPDAAPEIALARVERARGDRAHAVATIERVLRREPDNLEAWAALAAFAKGTDDAALERALAARRRLDPLNARR